MSIKSALAGFLQSAPGITAIAGDRSYPEVIPDQVFDAASKRPCVVWSRQSAERAKTFCGTGPLTRSTFSIDCYARTSAAAEELAQAVRTSLTDYRGTMGGVEIKDAALTGDFDLLDLEPGLFRVALSFDIWHDESF